jgi:hypothetical protein
MRDLRARSERRRGQTGDAKEVADVRQHPRSARLDELVVIEVVEVFLEDRDLVGEDVEQLVQRAVVAVAQAVDDG